MEDKKHQAYLHGHRGVVKTRLMWYDLCQWLYVASVLKCVDSQLADIDPSEGTTALDTTHAVRTSISYPSKLSLGLYNRGVMETEIHRLSLGLTNCYLIKQEGLILVDAGNPNKGKSFLKQLKDLSIEPKDVSLILATHGHWDHIGSIGELKDLTGCEIAVNEHEKDWLELGLKPIPPAISLWGKILSILSKIYMPFVKLTPTSVDLVLEDKEFPLESYGIYGKVVYTPGHSLGSMSLLLDTGDAFVGDLAMNGLPVRIGPGMPAFAEDAVALKESWRLVLDKGAKQIYPGHGKPFKAEELEKAFLKESRTPLPSKG